MEIMTLAGKTIIQFNTLTLGIMVVLLVGLCFFAGWSACNHHWLNRSYGRAQKVSAPHPVERKPLPAMDPRPQQGGK